MGTEKDLQFNKSKTRAEFARLRDDLVKERSETLVSLHSHIKQRVAQLVLQLSPKTTIASYKGKGSEVPTHNFETINPKAHWVYPRVQGNQLHFFKPKGFVKSSWGIDEPTEDSQEVSLHEVDMVLTPGTAFDRRGHRLGTGQGFYDRTLATYKGIKVGIAYALQVSSRDFVMESHDLPMEYVVTENYILKPLKRL